MARLVDLCAYEEWERELLGNLLGQMEADRIEREVAESTAVIELDDNTFDAWQMWVWDIEGHADEDQAQTRQGDGTEGA